MDETLAPQFIGWPVDNPLLIPPDKKDATPLLRYWRPVLRTGSPSGLSWRNQLEARDIAMRAAFLVLSHRYSVHYTQGLRRWEGIHTNRQARLGQYPHWGDCSSTYSWEIWNALWHFRIRDLVNGQHWRDGYTGTLLSHGRRVKGSPLRGDAVIYGRGWPGEHVAIYVGGGKVVSHGSEGGPYLLPKNYRRDILAIRRYI